MKSEVGRWEQIEVGMRNAEFGKKEGGSLEVGSGF